MIRFLLILFTGAITSMFYFPFEFVAFPGMNTKMMLAVLGLAFAAAELVKRHKGFSFPQELLILVFFASAVSLISLLSITVNQTPDTTYVSYIVSFFVWLSAAFAVCCCIRLVHGRVDVQMILDYLVGVCLFQCAIALIIDSFPVVARWVNARLQFGQDVAIDAKRLYGIGALLDVCGLRMAAVLVGLSFYLSGVGGPLKKGRRFFYLASFFIISVVGNMIARTAIVGMGIGLACIVFCLLFRPSSPGEDSKGSVLLSWVFVLLLGVIVCVILYNTNIQARKLFRFGFEGFFSLAERGYWYVGSNETLQTMVVFPETMHTWIIGDGYFMNSRYDENYLGDATDMGFYMGTDVGYLRFIFYFGILGLIPMMGVIIASAFICMRHFQKEAMLFFLALLVGLTVWFKVSTDIFLFFALFLSAAALQEGDLFATE